MRVRRRRGRKRVGKGELEFEIDFFKFKDLPTRQVFLILITLSHLQLSANSLNILSIVILV